MIRPLAWTRRRAAMDPAGGGGGTGVAASRAPANPANFDSDSVTELDAATGALVQVITGSSYQFRSPAAISSDGTHVWVANYGGGSVTELDAATGALVQVITGSAYGFDGPDAVSSDGSHVWVANRETSTVSELDAATGPWSRWSRALPTGSMPRRPSSPTAAGRDMDVRPAAGRA